MPHYVPGDKPTVPGHETVVRIVQVGPGVTRYKVGERYLVQTDYRWLPTANSASAFGYNFEGALQEYVLMDERVITSPKGESMLIPGARRSVGLGPGVVSSRGRASRTPTWTSSARSLKDDGKMLVVGEAGRCHSKLDNLLPRYGKPSDITWTTAD